MSILTLSEVCVGGHDTVPYVIHNMRSRTAGQEYINDRWTWESQEPTDWLELSLFLRVQFGLAEVVRQVTQFAKSISGFADLDQSDHVTLLKCSAIEVIMVRLAYLSFMTMSPSSSSPSSSKT